MKKNEFWSKEIWPKDNIAEISTYMGSCSLFGYADGFLEISEIAIERATENTCSIDTIMPSILYNLRHSVELFTKAIISEIPDGNGGHIVGKGHSIKKLFLKHKDVILIFLECECIHFQYKKWINEFEAIIDVVDFFDPDGQSMRYPADIKGNANLGGKALVSTNDIYCLIKHVRCYFDEYRDKDT